MRVKNYPCYPCPPPTLAHNTVPDCLDMGRAKATDVWVQGQQQLCLPVKVGQHPDDVVLVLRHQSLPGLQCFEERCHTQAKL